MEELSLVKPGLDYQEQIEDFRTASLKADPRLNGVGGLDDRTVPEWLKHLELCENEETCPTGLVPANTWMCVRQMDNRLVGMINLRRNLNDVLLNYGGHIGYSIHPEERGKGYAKAQLRLCLQKARDFGLDRVLLTCEPWNKASSAVIKHCGGVYEDKRTAPDGREFERYWIAL